LRRQDPVWQRGGVEAASSTTADTVAADRPFAPLVFRASARRLAISAFIAAIGGTLAAWGTGLPLPQALVAAALGALAYLGLSWWFRIARHGIRIDAAGVHRIDPGGTASIRWDDLVAVDPGETLLTVRGRTIRLRYAVLEGRGGERILFSDLSPLGSPRIRIDVGRPQPISDVSDSGLLLALVADRVGDLRYLPEVLMEHPRGDGDPARSTDPPASPEEKRKLSLGGLAALVLKVGTKLAKGIPAALKTIKPGMAVASGAVLGIFLSWQFALAMMLMLGFHEYGHVHAMRRAGLRVRGIYFIPLLGAAAVTEDLWKTRRDQAAIALNGPLWGLCLTALAFAVDAATGFVHPFLGVVTAWWALINLFNLLPVSPLDGGRILSALGYSLGSRFGLWLSLAMFATALVLAMVFEVTLLAIVGAVGLLEFGQEAAAAVRFRRLTASPRVASLSAEGLAALKGRVRPSLGEEADQTFFHLEMRTAARMRRLARVTPMKGRQAAGWGLAYVVVALALATLLIVASGTHPDAMLAREILR
jgi:hypothetical protein